MDHVKGKAFVLAVAPFEQPYFNLQYDRAIRAVLYSDYVNEDAYLDNPELYPEGPPNQHLDYITKDNGTEVPLGFFVIISTKILAPSFLIATQLGVRLLH